jgi:hypothetical protein
MLACAHKIYVAPLITAVVVNAVVLMCLVLALIPAYLWFAHADLQVKSVADAGDVLEVSQTTGCSPRALVQTDLGFYSLTDGISLGRGERLTLETRQTNRRYLCDVQHRCTRLI